MWAMETSPSLYVNFTGQKLVLTNSNFYVKLLENKQKRGNFMNRKYYLILDTETCNTIEQPLPYDIGWVICDSHGNIYEEKSFIVAETFLDMKDVMSTAYYAEKIPLYWKDVKNGSRIIKPMWTIWHEMNSDIKKYKVKNIGAYNMAFDKRALNNLMRYVSKSWLRWWFPFGVNFICIWNMACEVLMNRVSYIHFAEDNHYISEANNILTNAEICYRYITNKVDFVESHTGLEDVKIEVAILAECFRQHKKMNMGINTSCWRKVQKKRKEIADRTNVRSALEHLV